MSTINGLEMLSQSKLLEMGWTKTLIRNFLPEPVLKTNPTYKCAASMKLWQKEKILSTMQTPEFKSALEKSSVRKKAALQAVNTKRENLKELAKEFASNINVKHLEDDVLVHNAIANAYQWYLMHHEFGYLKMKDFRDADKETVNRWVVNYIRHKLTRYDKKIQAFERKVGKNEAYVLFQNMVMDCISEVYPKYKDECERQKKHEEFGDDYEWQAF